MLIDLTGKLISVGITSDDKFLATASFDLSSRILPFIHSNSQILYRKAHLFFRHITFKDFGTDTFSSIYTSYFNGYKDFLNSKTYSSNDQFYQGFYVTPHLWNIFHLAAIERNNQIFNSSFDYSSFKLPSLLDRYNKTPLYYLVISTNLDYSAINFMIQYIVDYLSDKEARTPYEVEQVLRSLSPLFKFILKKAGAKAKNQYLALCCLPSLSPEPLPKFGDLETKYVFSKTPIIYPTVKDQLHSTGDERVNFTSTMVYQDYEVTSDNMFKTALVLSSIKGEDTFKTPIVTKLIEHLWKRAKLTIIILSLYYSILISLFSVYVGMSQRNLSVEIVIICMSVLSLLGESLQAYELKENHFSSIFNSLDVIIPTLMIAFVGTKIAGSQNLLAQEWLSSLAIMLGYLRWISYLRFFKTTSKSLSKILVQSILSLGNLIEIIVAIIRDMLGFTIVLIFIFIGFALISVEFDEAATPYGDQLYSTFKILFASYDDSQYNVSQKLFTSLIVFLLNVVLLNLLISIMGSSYEKVQEKITSTDSLTRLDMILEAMIYMRAVKKGKAKEKGYLIYCEAEEIDDDNMGDEWEDRINLIKKALKTNDVKMQDIYSLIQKGKESDMRMEDEIAEVKKEMKTKMNELDGKIDTMNKKLEDGLAEILKQIKAAQPVLPATETVSKVEETK